MKPKNDLTPEFIRSILAYDYKSGIITRKYRADKSTNWNAQWAGQIAGTFDGGYIRLAIDGRSYFAHRIAWVIMKGEWPQFEVDHRDEDKSNNRWKNLRARKRKRNGNRPD
jgi:hypothetical protein